MPSTYTTNNGIEKPATGEQNNTWGVTLDNDFDLIDQSLDGVANIALSSGSYALTITSGASSLGRCRVLSFSGSPGGPVSVTISPSNISKWFWVANTANQALVFSNGSGATATVPASCAMPIVCNGAGNVYNLLSQDLDLGANINVPGNANVTGNVACSGTVSVPAAANLTIGGTNIQTFVNNLIPSLSSLQGTLVVSNISVAGVSGGSYVIFVFGNQPGTRVRIGLGNGLGGNGYTIPVPSGFSTSNMIATASVAQVSTTGGHALASLNVNIASAVISTTALDTSSTSYPLTASWNSVVWQTGY